MKKKEVNPNITLTLFGDSFEIKCDWDDNTIDTKNYGMMLAMLNSGYFAESINKALLDRSQDNKEVYNKIIDSADVFVKSIKPPAVDVNSDFDEDKKDNSVIIWERYQTDTNNNDLEDDEDESNELNEVVQLSGFPGLMTKDQFNNLVQKIRNSLPRMGDREHWLAHTNFSINNRIYNIIANTSGVEYITRLGRYSFIITTGRAFNSGDIQTDIENSIGIKKSIVE